MRAPARPQPHHRAARRRGAALAAALAAAALLLAPRGVHSQLQAADFATSAEARGAEWFRAFNATYDDSLSQRFASPGAR